MAFMRLRQSSISSLLSRSKPWAESSVKRRVSVGVEGVKDLTGSAPGS